MADWWLNEGPKYIILLLWMIINAILFATTYVNYNTDKKYFYLRRYLKTAVAWARGSAAVLNLNCALILLPVCRNLLSYARGSCEYAICSRRARRLMDKNITFHRYIGYMICLATAVHVYAHCFDFKFFLDSYDGSDPLLNTLNQLNTSLNPITSANADLVTEAIKTVPGVTGFIITLVLIVMYASSTEVIRRSYFEIFWYTHHLFIVFFLGLCLHAVVGVIKVQVNLDTHDPEYCYNKRPWGPPSNLNCSVPIFEKTSTPQTWKWVIGPIALYICERIVRFVRGQQKVVISKVVNHPSKVLELQMKKRGFQSVAGQYIFINCPSIARFEWHPFTLTSCPGDDYFSVHVRIVGDWTGSLFEACKANEGRVQEAWKMPNVYVDGPFGTCSEDVFFYEVAVCVGAGIGVTPFASILKSLWYKQQKSDTGPAKTKKVYFFWICPDSNAFEWFDELLRSLENEMLSHNMGDFLEYNIYLTRGLNDTQATNIMLRETEDGSTDAITGLQQKTHYGRPRWDQIFSNLASAHSGSDIGVFFCGPKVLSSVLHKECNKNTSANTRFFYNKENF